MKLRWKKRDYYRRKAFGREACYFTHYELQFQDDEGAWRKGTCVTYGVRDWLDLPEQGSKTRTRRLVMFDILMGVALRAAPFLRTG